MDTMRRDFLSSLAAHAVLFAALVGLGGRANLDVAKVEAPEEPRPLVAHEPAQPAKLTAPATAEPARTAEETGKALVGAEVKQSVAMAIPEGAPDSVKSQIAAALESALAEAMAAAPEGKMPSRAELEMAAAERVAGKLRAEVSGEFAESAAKDFSRRAFDSALKKLEAAVAEEVGPKTREMIAAAGAEMAADDPAQAPQRAAELAYYDKDAFQKALAAEAKRALTETAPALLAETAAEIVTRKLGEQQVPADEPAVKGLRDAVAKGVAENAAARGFNTTNAWKPPSELILPGTRKKKVDAPLAAKLAEVAEKQAAIMREALPRLAAEAAKAAKWNESFAVAKETEAKIATMHRLETHLANLKAGRGGAAEASLASSLAALLGSGGAANESESDFDGTGRWGSSGRNFKEDEYRKLLARLEGRPANAGAEADLQRVAGEPVNAATVAAGAAAPERVISLVEPTAPAVAVEEPIAPPPFPSATHTAAPYAAQRPTIDGDLSEWNTAAPRAEVRILENNTRLASGPDVFLQWRAEGLYFAYRLADAGGVQISSGAPYHGDCVELFVDTANSRAPRMRDSNSARQYFFMPFGYKGDSTRTFEKSGAAVPTGRDLASLNAKRDTSFCTAKPDANGYAVEGFLGIEALRRRLAPGIYLGFDVSVSPDFDFKNQMQWAAAKSLGNWDRPSTWGDLLLLGTNGRATFRGTNGAERRVAVAGESLLLEVADADMNLDAAARETVAVRLASNGGSAQVLLLTETGADTGIFQGPAVLGSAAAGALAVSGGDSVELTYIDAVNVSGTRNKPVAARLEVGWPVMRFGTHAAR